MVNVLILSAGLGTRLKPLTNSTPKALVKFKGKPLIDFQLQHFLKNTKIKKIFIATGYKKEKFEIYKNVKKISLIQIPEFKKKSMLFTMMYSLKKIGIAEDIIISYGDIIYNSKIANKILNCKNSLSTIFLTSFLKLWKLRFKKNYLHDLETFEIDKNCFIKNIGSKAKNTLYLQGQYVGISKIKKNFLSKIFKFYKTNLIKYDLNKKDITFFFNLLANNKFKIKGLPVLNGWLEFDTFEDWKVYEKYNLKKNKIFDINEFF
jgi:choline kinase